MSTLNLNWKNDKSAFGFRMLQKMGWSEDKGLGKNESGIVEHIKVKKRDEGIGLGMEQSSDSAGLLGWNETVSSFNNVLKVLNESYGNKKKKKKKDKKDKSSSSSSTKSKKITTISLGLKYKKISSSKDLSSKSKEELTAIFGMSPTRSFSSNAVTESKEENSENVDGDNKMKKKKKRKLSESD